MSQKLKYLHIFRLQTGPTQQPLPNHRVSIKADSALVHGKSEWSALKSSHCDLTSGCLHWVLNIHGVLLERAFGWWMQHCNTCVRTLVDSTHTEILHQNLTSTFSNALPGITTAIVPASKENKVMWKKYLYQSSYFHHILQKHWSSIPLMHLTLHW